MIYYVNGKYVDASKATISISDSGFLYGDGLFETMRFDNREIFSSHKHIRRLQKGLEIVNLKINYNQNALLNLLNTVIEKNNLKSGIIRLMITRGDTNNISESPSIIIIIKPFYDVPQNSVKVLYLEEEKFPIIRFTPAIKSMNYIGNMLAKNFADLKGAYEPVFYNKNKIITECAIRNIFYIKEKQVLTPSLDLGILSGVMRETIIEVVQSMGLDLKESHIPYNNINTMEEAFITSTGIGLLPCYWKGWNSKFHITKSIKKELFKRINNS